MTSCDYYTEKQYQDKLLEICKRHIASPNVLVAKRKMLGGVAYEVTFVCVIDRNNEVLISDLIYEGLTYEFIVVGSEINLQDEVAVDYIYVTAEVTALKNKES